MLAVSFSYLKRGRFLMKIGWTLLTLLLALGISSAALADDWSVNQNGNLLEISYGSNGNYPQYAVLDLASSYFRMNYGPTSGWGTSIDTMPSYWSGGNLYQGYGVGASSAVNGGELVLTVDGTSNTLATHETITLSAPSNNSITAQVAAAVTGDIQLDNRPGEAFKPVFLSSMHDSDTSWDASAPFVGSTQYAFPSGGWIIPPTPQVVDTRFGLLGGTSTWKTNAPTVTVDFAQPIQVAGWLTTDNNPNDDNVGFWGASDTVMHSFSYKLTVNGATAVPEPSTLLVAGIAAMGFLRKSKRRAV